MLAAFFLTLDLYKSWMERGSAPIILSADLIVCCSLYLSCFVDESNCTLMDEHRTDKISADPTHSAHKLFLPLGRRYRALSASFSQAVFIRTDRTSYPIVVNCV
ncbi:hypothetical protein ATANTOWER_026808 [Ataeniobius toweri]|uniref:Uncharacterized protein n=1 Tax=Ataeniobius toweri TaxID=208326 RepID=A0ABU7B9J8_9TELE|nr:hypothetical protein [Ataeniobius toweri]